MTPDYQDKGIKHIVSFSGGKDSTAMLLMMIEKEMQIDEIIFCDTGKEFPQMYEHIEKVSEYTGRQITTLKNKKSFEYYLGEYQIKDKTSDNYDRLGLGWPGHMFRWCTGNLKVHIMTKYFKNKGKHYRYLGIAYDEQSRMDRKHNKNKNYCYPLVEWGITENQALRYCYKHGFDWGGLYRKFKRVSCYCCPLQRLSGLFVIYRDYPELWADMQKMDATSYRQFRSDYSLEQLTKRFKELTCQIQIDFRGK